MPELERTASWTTLAHLLRPQGRRGELLAELLTDFPDRFRDNPRVFLAREGFAGSEAEARPVRIVNHWLPVGKNHGRVVLAFEGIDSITLAESLEGLDVLVPTAERVELEEDAEYIDDLLGCTVYDRALAVGVVTTIDFPTTADGTRRLPQAAPLLTVRTPSGEDVLIPYVQAFVIAIDTAAKRIDMTLPAGLLEINRGGAEAGSAEAGAEAGEDEQQEEAP